VPVVKQVLQAVAASPLQRRIRRDRLTYLGYQKLRSLSRAAETVREVPGCVIECGLALGGSGILLATELPDRPFHGYDLFAMIPPPGPNDPAKAHNRYEVIASGRSEGLGGETYYGYVDDLFGRVSDSFARYGVPTGDRIHLHKGLFEDTLDPQWPVSLAHIDCDWYDPVKLCLKRLTPWLSPGARVILDDYSDYGGAKKATDEHVAAHAGFSVERDAGHRVLVYAGQHLGS
jgi:O-methyltransferase